MVNVSVYMAFKVYVCMMVNVSVYVAFKVYV